jgi:hypothetical protein
MGKTTASPRQPLLLAYVIVKLLQFTPDHRRGGGDLI